MEYVIAVIGILVLIGIIVLILMFIKNKNVNNSNDTSKFTNDVSNSINLNLTHQLSSFQNNIRDAIKSEYKTTSDAVSEVNKLIALFGDKMATLNDHVTGLERVLGNNKQTGNFGEQIMDQILQAYYGDDRKLYETQYILSTGAKPDAVIFMPNELICIDSKFPVEFYRQYLSNEPIYNDKENCLKNLAFNAKKQIKDIKEKYIIPSITSDYAVMFVPSDSLLCLLHTKLHDVIDFAMESKVVVVSPSTLIAFISSLRVVKHDYEKSEKAREMYKALDSLADEFKRFTERWEKVSKDVNQLNNAKEDFDKTVNKINNKFVNIKNINLDEEDEKSC